MSCSWYKTAGICLLASEQSLLYSGLRLILLSEVGGTRGTHGAGERCLQDVGWEARK
jgi:hypothetical protein